MFGTLATVQSPLQWVKCILHLRCAPLLIFPLSQSPLCGFSLEKTHLCSHLIPSIPWIGYVILLQDWVPFNFLLDVAALVSLFFSASSKLVATDWHILRLLGTDYFSCLIIMWSHSRDFDTCFLYALQNCKILNVFHLTEDGKEGSKPCSVFLKLCIISHITSVTGSQSTTDCMIDSVNHSIP